MVLVQYRNRNSNWPIILADTVTNTETTLQREKLVAKTMGYFFNHKRDPQTKFAIKYSRFLNYFLKICVQFQALKNLYPHKKRKTWENWKKFEKKKFRFRKKKIWLGYWYQNWASVAHWMWTTSTYRERKLIFTLTLLTTSHFRNLSYNRPRWYGEVCHVQKRFLTLKPNLICTYL